MTEVRVLPRDSAQKLTSNDLNGTNSKPNPRNQLSACNGTQVSTLAQRFRENWLKCSPSFCDMDDSLTNLNWLFEMNSFSLESENFGMNRNSRFAIDRSSLLTNTKISWQPTHPYAGSLLDPQVRLDYRTKWTGKPPFSYASLICLAMRELGKPKVTLSDIYGWIMANFAYYRHTDSSWQNSVRHNLSLNKCFEKVPREKGERGKGGFWRVNPRHADWLEANLAKCRRAAPPPGPPPPIPRSLLLEKQQEQAQQHHQTTDSIYLAFSSPSTAQTASIYHATQPNQTFICYRSINVTPDVSNEIEAVTVNRTASDVVYQNQPQQQQQQQLVQQPQPQTHVRRRKTPPCSMYSSAEPDLVEVDPKSESSPQSNHGHYSAFSTRKRLALNARQRHSQILSQSGGCRRNEDNSYSEQRSWRIDSNMHYGVRKRRSTEIENSNFYYHPSAKRHHNQQHPNSYNNGASNYSYSTTSDFSKRRVETQLRNHTQISTEDHSTPILSEHISLPCLDSLPSIAEESDTMDTSNDPWKDDFFDLNNVLPWQTIADSNDEQSNLTVQCNTPEDSNNSTSNQHQNSSSSSPSPLASFTSFGQSVASSITSSNTDSGVASLVNPSDSLDLGPLDLDFDTVSSTLNDLVESNSCAMPPIDVDFGAELSDSMPKSLETPPTSENRDYDDSNWNFGVGDSGFFESGLSLS